MWRTVTTVSTAENQRNIYIEISSFTRKGSLAKNRGNREHQEVQDEYRNTQTIAGS